MTDDEPAPRKPERPAPAAPPAAAAPDARAAHLAGEDVRAEQVRFCPHCSAVHAAGAERCPKCNATLVGPAAVPAAGANWFLVPRNVRRLLLYLGPFALPLLWRSPYFSRAERVRHTVITLVVSGVLIAWAALILFWFWS